METFELRLTYSQIRMLKEMIADDMEMSSMEAPDYMSIDAMEYYLDRALVYQNIKALLKHGSIT